METEVKRHASEDIRTQHPSHRVRCEGICFILSHLFHLNMASFSLCDELTRHRKGHSYYVNLSSPLSQSSVCPVPIKREREGAIEYN
ncbi:hypothetical protein E2C01_026655 [Portunus trituberculatus]|uniref:Uncharacterized protein n=1 Tax=Portunus trituberculatus TaxID=210409 RepID=A0A5B7EGP5_PORTR|nr:hypothetical protein [Portunus trituberculatus]